MAKRVEDGKKKASGCLTIPFIFLCLFFGGKEGYNHINNNEPADVEYQAQNYIQQPQQSYRNYDIDHTKHQGKSLHEFNLENNPEYRYKNPQVNKNDEIHSLELQPDNNYNNSDINTLELKEEDYYY